MCSLLCHRLIEISDHRCSDGHVSLANVQNAKKKKQKLRTNLKRKEKLNRQLFVHCFMFLNCLRLRLTIEIKKTNNKTAQRIAIMGICEAIIDEAEIIKLEKKPKPSITNYNIRKKTEM